MYVYMYISDMVRTSSGLGAAARAASDQKESN